MERYDIPPPDRWEDFEDLCRDLWAVLWDDPDTRKHGRRGQPQAGVDVYGRPGRDAAWHGVQCKLKSQTAGTQLSRREIEEEVKKAKTFEPALAGFIIATTAPRDVQVERIVRKVSDKQIAQGSFPVTVRFWDDIIEDLQGHETLLRKHYRRWQGASLAGPRISTAKLPVTGETFVARKNELATLDEAWESGLNVLSFVAEGGAGKSALVNEWLGQMQKAAWRGANRVLGWSFYSQGTNAAGASSEAFTEFALDWLGYQGDAITSPWKKGEFLADLVRESQTLLILDGLEPLQHPPGPQKGRIKDPAVQALVRGLAADNPGLCVITTRLEVADVASRAGTDSVDLEKLPPEAGADLLRALGVKGTEDELRTASEELRGHGLALTLLGTYLRDICDGDIRRRGETAVLDDTVGIERSEHAKKVMAAYESWFAAGPGKGVETRVLRLLGLFDRPAEPEALDALRKTPEIPGLTEGIGAENDKTWKAALAHLRQARLLAPPESTQAVNLGAGEALDTHPLVRKYFGERLKETNPEAWREGNNRLYEHYRHVAPVLPETLKAMLPLFAAVVHGCRAAREQETYHEVYRRRIHRGDENFSIHRLGAFGAELTALAAFFEQLWSLPCGRLTKPDQAWLLNAAGFNLRAVGRLPEAVEPMRADADSCIEQEDWANAAIATGNLSELLLTLGNVAAAIEAAQQSVELADCSADARTRLSKRATLANALHYAGRWEESEALFWEAEWMQGELEGQSLYFYSIRGFHYCNLLLSQGALDCGSKSGRASAVYREVCGAVRRRAEGGVAIAQRTHRSFDIALNNLSLARAQLGLALTNPEQPSGLQLAAELMDRAVEELREAGVEEFIAHGLLARATLRRLAGNSDGAATDLREAQEIAERGSMRLHEADAHLEWTRLHLATGDRAAAREHLDRARDLVRECGYGRREREVKWLEGQVGEGN